MNRILIYPMQKTRMIAQNWTIILLEKIIENRYDNFIWLNLNNA